MRKLPALGSMQCYVLIKSLNRPPTRDYSIFSRYFLLIFSLCAHALWNATNLNEHLRLFLCHVLFGQRPRRGRSPKELRGTFVRPSVSLFVRLFVHLSCPLKPEIYPLRPKICPLSRPERLYWVLVLGLQYSCVLGFPNTCSLFCYFSNTVRYYTILQKDWMS